MYINSKKVAFQFQRDYFYDVFLAGIGAIKSRTFFSCHCIDLIIMSRSIIQSQLESLLQDLPSGSSEPVVKKPLPKGTKKEKRSSGQKTKVSANESLEFGTSHQYSTLFWSIELLLPLRESQIGRILIMSEQIANSNRPSPSLFPLL